MHGLSENLFLKIKQRSFDASQETNLWFSFYFFQKLDLSVLVDLEKIFNHDTLEVNLEEVLKLLQLCMDCHQIYFKW